MKIIITGGSGLIGSELTLRWTKADHEIVVLSRSPENIKDLPKGARAVQWDGKTADSWVREVEGTQLIVNLAGENLGGSSVLNMRWTRARRERILNSRINAGKAIVAAIENASNKPELLIQMNAIGYYGPNVKQPVTEASPSGDGFAAAVTVAWEKSTQSVDMLGVRRVVFRNAVVLHNENFAYQMVKLPYLMFVGGPLGSGEQYFPWIHIQDLMAAFDFVIENKLTRGVYNLVTPQVTSMNDFGSTLGRVYDRPHWLPVPGFALRLPLGEVADLVLGGQNAKPARLLEAGFEFQFPDAESAIRHLKN